MKIELLAHDANQTDGTDLSKMDAIYRVGPQTVRIPATLQGQERINAVCTQLGIDPIVFQLRTDWQTLVSQAASRPLATMTISEVMTWINTNATTIAGVQTALREMAKEVFLTRAKVELVAKALDYLFSE